MSYVPDEAQTRAGNLFHSYRRGYSDGAAFKGYDKRYVGHPNAELVAEYDRGFWPTTVAAMR